MSSSNELPRSVPEAQGVSSTALIAFLEGVQHTKLELHSLMLLRHGVVVAEGWWAPYKADYRHLLNSLSKSFTSTAIGMAVAEKLLTVDDQVISFFPDALPDTISDNLKAMRVSHLLSMASGHADDAIPDTERRSDSDWVRTFLSAPVIYTPGTHFAYNSGATYMLSAILQKLTGMRLLDYLRPRLFEPLGITDVSSEISPQGIHVGGWGMSITTEAIARFGQLYLQNGLWQGQQLVPVEWIMAASSFQVSNAGTNDNLDWQQGYGYQFWRCQHGAYRGDGAYGQFCVVLPDRDAVLAITAGVDDMQAVLNLVWDRILPGLQSQSLAPNPEAADQLAHALSRLHIDPPAGKTSSVFATNVSDRQYTLAGNLLALVHASFTFEGTHTVVTVQTRSGVVHTFRCGLGQWEPGKLGLFHHSSHMVASGVWTAEDLFEITLRFYETSAIYTIRCHFAANSVQANVNIKYLLNSEDIRLTGATYTEAV